MRVIFICTGFFLANQISMPSGSTEGVRILKDEIFSVLEQCRSNLTPNEFRENPEAALQVSCESICIESRLNEWLSSSRNNQEEYLADQDFFVIERKARLHVCRSGQKPLEQTQCLAEKSPDIVAKIGAPQCGFHMECYARFDVDDDGNPINSTAECPSGVARLEFERETLCLLSNMRYPAIRGSKNLIQPILMRHSQNCSDS